MAGWVQQMRKVHDWRKGCSCRYWRFTVLEEQKQYPSLRGRSIGWVSISRTLYYSKESTFEGWSEGIYSNTNSYWWTGSFNWAGESNSQSAEEGHSRMDPSREGSNEANNAEETQEHHCARKAEIIMRSQYRRTGGFLQTISYME